MFWKRKTSMKRATRNLHRLTRVMDTLTDLRREVSMEGVNTAALGHDLGDDITRQQQPTPSPPHSRPKRNSTKPQQRRQESLRRRARREEAEVIANPWGTTIYPSDC